MNWIVIAVAIVVVVVLCRALIRANHQRKRVDPTSTIWATPNWLFGGLFRHRNHEPAPGQHDEIGPHVGLRSGDWTQFGGNGFEDHGPGGQWRL